MKISSRPIGIHIDAIHRSALLRQTSLEIRLKGCVIRSPRVIAYGRRPVPLLAPRSGGVAAGPATAVPLEEDGGTEVLLSWCIPGIMY